MRNPKFHALLKSMADTHDKKNADYAHEGNPYSNFEEAAAYAGVSVDDVFNVLIGVKTARLIELFKSGKTPQNESVVDTLLDRAVYAALHASYHMDEPTENVRTFVGPGFLLRHFTRGEFLALDPDTRLQLHGGTGDHQGKNPNWCNVRSGGDRYGCRRFAGHAGIHAAFNAENGQVLATWYAANEVPDVHRP